MSAPRRRWPPAPHDVFEVFRLDLNQKRNAEYEIVERPDTKERKRPAIDYLLCDRRSGHEVAVEVSSIWRSTGAGMEDAYIDKWWERVCARVEGRIHGDYHVALPISVPRGVSPIVFGDALVDLIKRDGAALARRRDLQFFFDIAGVQAGLSQAPIQRGNSISYARFMPKLADFPESVKKCLDDKAPKLKPYSDQGVETHIIIFNTMGVAMSPFEVEKIARAQCGPAHEHVTHINLVCGMPPDDAWVQVIR